MKKKVLASLLCASMVATMFAGCGSGNGGNGTEKADKKDGGKETITVMGPAEDLDDAQGAWLKTECEAFAKANPDFNIEFKYVTSSESDAKDVVTKDPKAAADVYMFANDQLEPLIKANAIAKLGGDTAEYVKSSTQRLWLQQLHMMETSTQFLIHQTHGSCTMTRESSLRMM